MDLVLMTQALHMQMSPPFVQAAVLLAAHCARALKAQRISGKPQYMLMTAAPEIRSMLAHCWLIAYTSYNLTLHPFTPTKKGYVLKDPLYLKQCMKVEQ